MSSAEHPRVAAGLGGVAAAWLLVLALAGVDHTLLYLLPGILLALPLLAGWFPGEEAIERLAARPRRSSRRSRVAARALPGRHRIARRRVAAGGALLASRLAGRAPPVAA